MNDLPSRTAPPASHRTLDLFVLVAAAWTVLCNVLVLVGGSFHALLWCSPLALLAGAGAWMWVLGRDREPPETAAPPARTRTGPWWRAGMGLLGVGALGLLWHGPFRSELLGTWALLVGFFLLACVLFRTQPEGPAETARSGEGWLWLLAGGAALFSLFVHRVSLDDALYVNFAVGALDGPTRPLLRFDTLHEQTDVPLMFSMYRMHSLELGAAALARLSGMPVLAVFHLVFPALFSLLGTLAYGRLLRFLAPRTWLLATFGTLLILATCGQVPRTFETHFLRLAQGKSLVLVLFLPLTIRYAAAFAAAPSRAGWALLMAVQVAAAGASANGAWILPTVAAMSLVGGLRGRLIRKESLRRLGLGVAASAYVALIVVIHLLDQPPRLLRGGRMPGVVVERTFTADPRALAQGQEVVLEAWTQTFLDGPRSLAAWGTLLLAALCCRSRRSRWLLGVLCLGLLLLLLNPFLAPLLSSSLLGRSVYARVLWVLPWPALAALVLTVPARWARRGPAAGVALSLLLLGGYVAVIPSPHVFREDSVHLGFGRLAVPADEWEAARQIQEHAPPGMPVLAANGPAAWLVCREGHPPPIACRPVYLTFLKRHLPAEEVQQRQDLFDLVSGRDQDLPPRLLRQGIRQYGLGSVCLDNRVRARNPARWQRLTGILREEGFRPVHQDESFHVWVRDGRD